MIVDTEASIHFLRTAYEPDDWIAVFLKSYETGQTLQRVGPLSLFLEPKVHAWLRAMNARSGSMSTSSVNAVTRRAAHAHEGRDRSRPAHLPRSRRGRPASSWRRSRPAPICRRCHTFSSPRRADCTSSGASPASRPKRAERLQKHLARELGTDPAATSCSQTTRIAGISESQADAVAPDHCSSTDIRSRPAHPCVVPRSLRQPTRLSGHRHRASQARGHPLDVVERARRYLARVEPAIAGQHGDLHTYQVCCRIARGFALDDAGSLRGVERVECAVRAAMERARARRQDRARPQVWSRTRRRSDRGSGTPGRHPKRFDSVNVGK